MPHSRIKKTFALGPAILVTAAFIGPGTVITASKAGADFGYALCWVLLFATAATIILQEMAARLGVVTQMGLGENLRQSISNPLLKWLLLGLATAAIVIGNGAYQSGNIAGAALGLNGLFGSNALQVRGFTLWPLIIGSSAFILLWRGSYALIEKFLMLLVFIMSLAFVFTFLTVTQDLSDFFKSLLTPSIPTGATLTVIALLGTSIVPYNLFLHAASAAKKWQSPSQLPEARRDIFIAIPLGGLISIAIIATGAAAFFGKQLTLNNSADLAPALQPLFGDWASGLLAFGLFSAGLSSAITAPLAAAFALSGILNIQADLKSKPFKIIWASILIIGVFVASFQLKPVTIIWFAQVANGLLLPIIATFLLWAMNQPRLQDYKNTIKQNILGGLIVLISLLLGGRSLLSAFGLI